jgi:hypothetical protein
VLTGNQQPDHSRISDFRLVHLDALAGLFVQVLRLCQKAGLVSLGNVALDGTKVKANASKHKAMSHERMLKTEAQLEAEIAALLRKAELIDAQEDTRYGKGKRGDELPKELQLRQDRLDALRKAKAELEAEAAADHARRREQQARAAEEQAAEAAAQVADAEAATVAADLDKADAESEAAAQALAKEAHQAERRARSARGRAELACKLAIEKAQAADLSTPDPLSSADPLAMPSRNLPTTAAGDPKANAQRNHRCAEGCAYTDPDSHILKGGDGWIQGFPSFLVDLSLKRCLETLVWVVLAEEVGLANEEALTVVIAIDEPAGDVVGLVAADLAGGGIENGQAEVSISLDNNYFGATPETKDPACC